MARPLITYDEEFGRWLNRQLRMEDGVVHSQHMVGDALARCRRINEDVRDLDEAYRTDRCQSLLRLLTELRFNESGNPLPPGRLVFVTRDPKRKTPRQTFEEGMTSLREAVLVYIQFRNEANL